MKTILSAKSFVWSVRFVVSCGFSCWRSIISRRIRFPLGNMLFTISGIVQQASNLWFEYFFFNSEKCSIPVGSIRNTDKVATGDCRDLFFNSFHTAKLNYNWWSASGTVQEILEPPIICSPRSSISQSVLIIVISLVIMLTLKDDNDNHDNYSDDDDDDDNKYYFMLVCWFVIIVEPINLVP